MPGTTRRFIRYAFAVVTAVALACSEKSTEPEPQPMPNPPLGPTPGGVLLAGDPAGSAVAATQKLPPSPVEPGDTAEGLFTTRLEALFDPTATAGDVNTALEAHGARIVAMDAGSPLVTLVIDAVTGRPEAEAKAVALAAEEAILDAAPVPDPDVLQPVEERAQGEIAFSDADYFTRSRMHAAKNALQLAYEQNHRVTVLVPDNYHELTPHEDIVHDFAGNGLATNFGDGNTSWGNWGFHASGVIAAWPNSAFEPFHPAPELLLDVRSIPQGGMGWADRVRLIANEIPSTGHVVISNSRSYIHQEIETYTRYERSIHAWLWRTTGALQSDRTFIATAAGDDGQVETLIGEARFGTFFGVSSAHPNLMDALMDFDEDHQQYLQTMIDLDPAAEVPTTNVVSVGASDVTGAEEPTSSRESDVRMVSRGVEGPCVFEESGSPELCTNGRAAYTGSQSATPQVAALAAYLWNLDPDRTPEEIRTILDNAYTLSNTPGVVDAYAAVLSLDPTAASGAARPVRRAILDVVRGPGNPSNDRFDEDDLEAYLDAFDEGGSVDASTARYDLNGDGELGGGTARFDLDGNAISLTSVPVEIGGEEVTFDESAVTDLEVLCYYAHSSLYVGSESVRDELLTECGGEPTTGPGFATVAGQLASAGASARAGGAETQDTDEDPSLDIGPYSDSAAASATSPPGGNYNASADGTSNVSVNVELGPNDVIRRLSGTGSGNGTALYQGENFVGSTYGRGIVAARWDFTVTNTVEYSLNATITVGGDYGWCAVGVYDQYFDEIFRQDFYSVDGNGGKIAHAGSLTEIENGGEYHFLVQLDAGGVASAQAGSSAGDASVDFQMVFVEETP